MTSSIVLITSGSFIAVVAIGLLIVLLSGNKKENHEDQH